MKDKMKLYELTINEHGIRFRHANPDPLTENQKCGLVLALLGVVSFLGFFSMIV